MLVKFQPRPARRLRFHGVPHGHESRAVRNKSTEGRGVSAHDQTGQRTAKRAVHVGEDDRARRGLFQPRRGMDGTAQVEMIRS
jgi:hypothetical protein